MGILNTTPDSFSDGGDFIDEEAAVAHATQMVDSGALIIDVGGESTRPGAEPISAEEELARVLPVVKRLVAADICVSIDTRHASVARACAQAGVHIINDVSGFEDPAMIEVAREFDVGLVVMHGYAQHAAAMSLPEGVDACKGMYDDVVFAARDFLRERCALLESKGIAHCRICVDPGPGFGKTAQQTLDVVRNMHEFRHLGYPVMAALSRKSYIGVAYGIPDATMRDEASAEEAVMAAELGASILRVHNVEMTATALKAVRPYAIIGLGCNVALVAEDGEEQEGMIAQLNMAIGDLCVLPDTQLIDVAGFYRSEPAYYEDQDAFVNTVALIRTGIAPHELLGYLHAIENKLGRVREVQNGPRTCDLDIEDYQLYACDDEQLTLPHPRVCERDFVVKPLLEILPGHVLSDGTPVESILEGKRIGHAEYISRS